MSTATKLLHSGMTGAPALGATAGSLLTVLDAALRTGFGQVSVTSLVVADGIATATVSSHSAEPGVVIQIAGVTGGLSALNGDHRVSVTSGVTVQFPTTEADGTATGTITLKIAPLGWTRPFTGTNVGVYRPTDAAASGFCLRVSDTGTQTARVVGYESMTDVNTGVRAFPLAAQMSGGLYWAKTGGGNAAWAVIGDARMFYLCVDPTGNGRMQVVGFGDLQSLRSGDAFACFISGARDVYVAPSTTVPHGELGASEKNLSYLSGGGGRFFARGVTGVGGAVPAVAFGEGHIAAVTTSYSGSVDYGLGAYPNQANNGLLLCRVVAYEGTGHRAIAPGCYHVVQDAVHAFNRYDLVEGSDDLLGQTLVAIPVGRTDSDASSRGCMFFSLADWRV